MFSIFTIIHGKVITDEDVTKLEALLPEWEIEEWIEDNEFGNCPYSGADGTIPRYIGVALDSIDFSSHGKSLHNIKVGPTSKDSIEVHDIIKRIQDEFGIDIKKELEFEPDVFIVHSTS